MDLSVKSLVPKMTQIGSKFSKFLKIQKKTPVPESLIKLQTYTACDFIQKEFEESGTGIFLRYLRNF